MPPDTRASGGESVVMSDYESRVSANMDRDAAQEAVEWASEPPASEPKTG